MRIHRNEKYMMAATSGCRRRSVFKMSDIDTTDVDMFTIGNNLRELREQKRVTQMQVVDVLGVSYTHYAKIDPRSFLGNLMFPTCFVRLALTFL